MIKGQNRQNIYETTQKIKSGAFRPIDVNSLLIGLRPYSKDFPIVREMADFVAHNDERVKGHIVTFIERLYLSFKYFTEYVEPGPGLDLTRPFPLYIKRLMQYQIDLKDETILKQQVGLTKRAASPRIDSIFGEDKKTGEAFIRDPKNLSQENSKLIRYLLTHIDFSSSLTQTEIINQLI